MRKEHITVTNNSVCNSAENKVLEGKGMKSRFIHFKKRFVPAVSGALMAMHILGILLNEDYYSVLLKGRTVIDGLSVLRPEYLILFKAKAYMDLKAKRDAGEIKVCGAFCALCGACRW